MLFVESEVVELKAEIVGDICKEVIAFANTKGGTLYIGVSNDGSIVGVENADRVTLQLNNMIRRQELSDALDQAVLWVDITDHALGCLEDQEKELLVRIYIEGDWGNVTQLAQDLGMERSTVYRRRDEALRKFTVAMYGKC